MSNLTEKLAVVIEQMVSNQLQTNDALSAIQSTLSNLDIALETLNNNGATNTRYLLAAIGANSPCAPCPTPSLEVPPASEVPLVLDDEQCQRAQALIHALQALAAKFDLLNNFGVGFNPTVALSGIQEVLDGLGEPSPVPAPSWAEVANMVSNSLAYATANFDTGISLSEYFAPLIFTLRDAFYSAGSPAAALSSYAAIVGGSSIPYGANGLLIAIGYTDLFGYYLDPANDVDLTGYDGTVCVEVLPIDCVQRASILTGEGATLREEVFLSAAYLGWTVNVVEEGFFVRLFGDGNPTKTIDHEPYVLLEENLNITLNKFWFSREPAIPWHLQMCPPLE